MTHTPALALAGLILVATIHAPQAAAAESIKNVIVTFVGSIPSDINSTVAASGGQVVDYNTAINFIVVTTAHPSSFAADMLSRSDVRSAYNETLGSTLMNDEFCSIQAVRGQTTTNVQCGISCSTPLANSPGGPNDLYYQAVCNGKLVNWPLQLINAGGVMSSPPDSHAIRIAVVDTGVDTGHLDLQANLLPGLNFIDPSANGAQLMHDDSGHGTFVIGQIAAATNNQLGYVGMSQAFIFPIRACYQDQTTLTDACPASKVADAISFVHGEPFH